MDNNTNQLSIFDLPVQNKSTKVSTPKHQNKSTKVSTAVEPVKPVAQLPKKDWMQEQLEYALAHHKRLCAQSRIAYHAATDQAGYVVRIKHSCRDGVQLKGGRYVPLDDDWVVLEPGCSL